MEEENPSPESTASLKDAGTGLEAPADFAPLNGAP
jgi:hypothetical protein